MIRFAKAVALAAILGLGVAPTPGTAGDVPKNPSGKILARAEDMTPGVPRAERFRSLVLVDPDSGKCEAVGGPDSAGGMLSPDGRFLAASVASRDPEKNGVWVEDLTGKLPRRRVFEHQRGYPSWSHGGRKLIISHPVDQGGGKFETYAVNADGTGLTKLPVAETESVIGVTPDGSWLASWNPQGNDRERPNRILLTRADGSETRELVNETRVLHFHISPDGQDLAFAVLKGDREKPSGHLHVIGLDGTGRRELPIRFEHGTPHRCVWSPDGKRLAVGVFGDGTGDAIVVLDRDGKHPRSLPLPNWRLVVFDWR